MLKLVCRELPPKGILETTKYEGGGEDAYQEYWITKRNLVRLRKRQ